MAAAVLVLACIALLAPEAANAAAAAPGASPKPELVALTFADDGVRAQLLA